MSVRHLLVAAFAAVSVLAPSAHSAPSKTALVVSDATGDANFSGVHGGAVPAGSQSGFDIKAIVFDTVKVAQTSVVRGRRVTTMVPTKLSITLQMASAPSTMPTSSYGVAAESTACGAMRLQIYYSESGPTTYGDLSDCGSAGTTTNADQFSIAFSPRIANNDLIIEIPFKALPKQFKVGSLIEGITGYTSNAEFVVAGYQPTDFNPRTGIDTVEATKPWKIA